MTDADVLIVGGGLAGLVAAAEAAEAGRKVMLLDQESEQSLGGQAFWSFGGLFFVDSPEQRRMGIRDSAGLAREDWFGSAGFDRPEDHWPRQWAEAYLDFAGGEKRAWLHAQGMRWFPVVGWAERGGWGAVGHGNSVPRFHITWGTGPGVVAPFERRVRAQAAAGRIAFRFRHRVTELFASAGRIAGVRGEVLEASTVERGRKSSRVVAGQFEFTAGAVIVASGGIGGNRDLVHKNWPARLGSPPATMICGVPDHVDGLMIGIAAASGARVINPDRMWHYVEGVRNFAPIWTDHAIRILPGPSSLWLDALGRRLPPPLFPGFDTLGTLEHLRRTGHDHSWFITNQRILRKEFALSGSEQNPDLTGRSIRGVLGRALAKGAPAPVEAFKQKGADFIVRDDLEALIAAMRELEPASPLDGAVVRREVEARDRQLDNPFGKDLQIAAIRAARAYRGDRLIRTVAPHRLTDPKAGPLIAVRLNILTRKTLGGLETDLEGRAIGADGQPLAGLYAAGEAAGFGGGGLHGYRALEGTFLGGCIFSGRTAGRSAAAATRG
jgi:hypothetical protein